MPGARLRVAGDRLRRRRPRDRPAAPAPRARDRPPARSARRPSAPDQPLPARHRVRRPSRAHHRHGGDPAPARAHVVARGGLRARARPPLWMEHAGRGGGSARRRAGPHPVAGAARGGLRGRGHERRLRRLRVRAVPARAGGSAGTGHGHPPRPSDASGRVAGGDRGVRRRGAGPGSPVVPHDAALRVRAQRGLCGDAGRGSPRHRARWAGRRARPRIGAGGVPVDAPRGPRLRPRRPSRIRLVRWRAGGGGCRFHRQPHRHLDSLPVADAARLRSPASSSRSSAAPSIPTPRTSRPPRGR